MPCLGMARLNDGKGMIRYLTRIGIDEKLLEHEFQGHSQEYIDSCFQQWLFFFSTLGRFSRIRGLWLNNESLIAESKRGPQSPVVTTRYSPDWTAAVVLKRYCAIVKIDMPAGATWKTVNGNRSNIFRLVVSTLGPRVIQSSSG